MQLPVEEGILFYKLYSALCLYANDKLKVAPDEFSEAEQYTLLPPETRMKVRDALHAQPELIDQFVQENPAHLTTEEAAIVASWRHAVSANFYVFRFLKHYAVFLSDKSPPKAYGVLALATPFEELVGPRLPVLAKAVLLPINGRIIYDGVLSSYRLSFGPGIRRRLNEDYQHAKEVFGIFTSLPECLAKPPEVIKKKVSKKKPKESSGKTDVNPVLRSIVEMTDQFCRDRLDEEYSVVCRKLAEKLSRKRPSPLLRGKPATWACGIVRTIGWVNFLDDRSQTPHMMLTAIDEAFAVSQSTGQGKSRTIRKMLKIRQFDPEWTLPSHMDDNPMIWMLEVNGFILDIRQCSRDMQEMAFEKGLIPYIPADRME